MLLYVEVWDARPAWLALSIQDRITYLDQMESSMQALAAAGASLVGMGLRESEAPCLETSRYVAVWSMPDEQTIRLLNEILTAVGWHTYFKRGEDRSAPVASKSLFQYAEEQGTPDRLPSVRRN